MKSALIQNDGTRQVWTPKLLTDARTALIRGLKEYVEELSLIVPNRHEVAFRSVSEGVAEPEKMSAYPNAAVYGYGPGNYAWEDGELAPLVVDSPDSMPENVGLLLPGEYTMDLAVEVWATDPYERTVLTAMLERAFSPVEWMSGFRLVLPHYAGAHATFGMKSSDYTDDEPNVSRRYRRALVLLEGRVPVVRFKKFDRLDPRAVTEVE